MTQIVIDNTSPLTIEQVNAIALRESKVELSECERYRDFFNSGREYLQEKYRHGESIYGVTTGYGESCQTSVPADELQNLTKNLRLFLGCGTGDNFSVEICRAILVSRIRSLSNGVSGVRYELLAQMVELLKRDIIPVIPSQGTVGASGDLVPLSYIAAALAGERDVYFNNEIKPSSDILKQCNLAPLTFEPKETLAIVNGTAVMTAVACIAYSRAQKMANFSTIITAISSLALEGNIEHFDAQYFSYKPHPGQSDCAQAIRQLITECEIQSTKTRMQDRYSIRCAPHIIGVLNDALTWFRSPIEIELNSANDNPLIDGEKRHIMHGGHFYGGHIAFCMDSLKTAVANIADLADRQMALLIDTKFNNGLPANLSGASADSIATCHGLKGLQIAVSSLTSEALKLTMPASVFSRSTECHNQDKVSLGTISARDCLTIVELTERVLACVLLASVQALELRLRLKGQKLNETKGELGSIISTVRDKSDFLTVDRELQCDINVITSFIRN